MCINELFCHRKSLREVYAQLPFRSMSEAANESLKIGDLVDYPKSVSLLNGKVVNYGVALCAACVSSIDSRFPRKAHLTEDDKQFIAERMVAQFKHWSVLDLPCFEAMLIGARIPTLRNGQTEYELSGVNIPSILSKCDVYDRMRPNPQALQGSSPARSGEKPLTPWHMSHLMDGREYTWASYQDAWNYWKAKPNMDDPDERKFIESVGKATRDCCKKVS